MARAANCAKEQIQWDDEVEGNKKKCFVKIKRKNNKSLCESFKCQFGISPYCLHIVSHKLMYHLDFCIMKEDIITGV